MMKIKVIKQNEFNVLFDMVTDDLPNEGNYILVPEGKELEFAAKAFLDIAKSIQDLKALPSLVTYKLDDIQMRVNAILKKVEDESEKK